MTSKTLESTESPRLEERAKAPVPTRFGLFDMYVFRWEDPAAHPDLSRDHIALVHGDVAGRDRVPVRVHSECVTSEVFGSLKCDCREQLERAQAEIVKRGHGVVLYLRQEGRGIGLANKLKAYALQAEGADTIEANLRLHLPIEAREYDVAAAILRHLEVNSIQLMTNNPEKVHGLERLGIKVCGRIPVLIPANPYSRNYLEVKRERMAHALPQIEGGLALLNGELACVEPIANLKRAVETRRRH